MDDKEMDSSNQGLVTPIRLENLDIVIVHYLHILPTVATINAFFKYYPELEITLVDNSGSRCCVRNKVLPHLDEHKNKINVIVNPGREHGKYGSLCHGAGIDFAVANTQKPYIVSMETDTFVLKRGGLEFLLDLINAGNDWAGLGQKPYNGKFGSFSPSFAAFSVELARQFKLSFKPRHRKPEDIAPDDLILKHHLETLENLRAGKEIQFMDGKPPDTYRRSPDQIIVTELGHLGYFDTAEWFHHFLSQKGYTNSLFQPIDSICHIWGSRDEWIFLENFGHRLPKMNLNDFLPRTLQITIPEILDLECLSFDEPKVELTELWHVNNKERAQVKEINNELEIRVTSPDAPVYLMLGSEVFDSPTQMAPDATIDANTPYHFQCSSTTKEGELSQQLWIIEYGDGKRLAHHTVPVKSPQTELRFRSNENADSFRVLKRFSGVGTVIISGMHLATLSPT